jgi:death-on-curing protein
MDYGLLSAEMAEALHDAALNPGQLSRQARDKSLEGALARVENRIAYELIGDAFHLAAAYCLAVAQGDCFNDDTKRTAFHAMDATLVFNGRAPECNTEEVGQIVIRAAQGPIDEGALAEWLRAR